MRFYRNFYVFSNNNLFSPNTYELEEDNQSYDRLKMVPLSHLAEDGIGKYILDEIYSSKAINMPSSFWNIDEARFYIEEYYIKNLFVTVYKYVMGIYKLYRCDNE